MTTNSFVKPCTECKADTCLHNVSTRPAYHDWECWTCGVFYDSRKDEINTMTEEERLQLKTDMEEEE
jgi:hypothetical protein